MVLSINFLFISTFLNIFLKKKKLSKVLKARQAFSFNCQGSVKQSYITYVFDAGHLQTISYRTRKLTLRERTRIFPALRHLITPPLIIMTFTSSSFTGDQWWILKWTECNLISNYMIESLQRFTLNYKWQQKDHSNNPNEKWKDAEWKEGCRNKFQVVITNYLRCYIVLSHSFSQ